ncbi:hypothetical protein [Micavibrio aeruginosavorus]|uniref:hypothetical protein n=1 Tax=Micavibrio aeruginosavorus TaxID=349221 RepID=UPI003F4AE089
MLNTRMLKNMLKQSFNRASRDSGKDCLINYVWINKSPDEPDRKAACSVSFKHIDCAHENARLYPDARIKIWIDYRFLDERSIACLREHHTRFSPPNVEWGDLNDIPQYHNDDAMFSPDSDKNIWARVDLARLIVLKHVLKTAPQPYAFYADFDVKDAKLDKAKAIMDQYGLALGTTGAIKSFGHMLNPVNFFPGMLENGYFAFKKGPDGRKFLHTLLSHTFASATREITGYTPFSQLARDWGRRHDMSPTKKLAVSRVLYDMGYKIPENPRYKDWNWN